MKQELITIRLKSGLDATPAAMLVQVASRYDSRIYMQSEDGSVKVNAKSIMGMMSLGLHVGENIMVMADGADEEAAVCGIKEYLSNQ